MTFANPVQISANTTYVVSYYDPDGHYAVDTDLFDWPLNTPPLTAPRAVYTGTGGGNGVFNAGGPGFPTSTYPRLELRGRRDLRHHASRPARRRR